MNLQDAQNAGYISTHTLTWSVTANPRVTSIYNPISTHTLTWSVTQTKTENLDLKKNFNSHAHVERDLLRYS